MELADVAEQELVSAISTRESAVPAPPSPDYFGRAFEDAMQTANQWLRTWRRTGNGRHFDTAHSCQAISKERFLRFLTAAQADRAEQALRCLQWRAEMDAIREELWGVLATSRRALHRCPSNEAKAAGR